MCKVSAEKLMPFHFRRIMCFSFSGRKKSPQKTTVDTIFHSFEKVTQRK